MSATEQAEMAAYFRGGPPPATTEEMADYYQKLDMFGVLFAIDAETATGRPPVPNEYFADCMKRWPDTFTAFGNVDPWKGKAAVREAQKVKDLGLKGLKFHPSTQQFYPNDSRFYPLWAKAQELGLIVLFHSGTTGVGAGRPGAVASSWGTRSRSRTWTTSRPTSRSSPSSWRTRRGPGRRSSWRCSSTSPTCTWTSPAGRRSTSRRR